MSAKHSPAPWKNGRDAKGDVVICQADYTTGAERNEEYQANRALFDSAPELLAALKVVVDLVDCGIIDPASYDADGARAAIAKAEGR